MTEKPRAADPESTGPAPGGSAPTGPAEGRAGERVVIRDKRRIDPSGGQARPAGESAGPAGDGEPDGTDAGRDGTSRPAEDGAEPDERSQPDGAPGARHRRGEEPEGAGAGQSAKSDADVEADAAAAAADDDDVDADRPAEAAETGPDDDGEQESPVVDEAELAHVLEQDRADPEPTVVDEPSKPVDNQPEATGPLGAELEALRAELDERTSDLQRISAEYANYRKRVDRDRGLVAEQAIGTVLAALLPILDDLDRAREHGDLVGPFGSVAEQIATAVGKFGLTAFGEKGDAFDPTRHEAVAHQTSAEVSEPTCVDVMRRGYLLGERLLRPALVAVADPE